MSYRDLDGYVKPARQTHSPAPAAHPIGVTDAIARLRSKLGAELDLAIDGHQGGSILLP